MGRPGPHGAQLHLHQVGEGPAQRLGRVREATVEPGLKAAQRALTRANRKLARAAEDSTNRATARKRVAGLHLRVADRRRDFLHKTTTRLTRTKSAIAV